MERFKTHIRSAIAFSTLLNAPTVLATPDELSETPVPLHSQLSFLMPLQNSTTIIGREFTSDNQQLVRETTSKEKIIGELRLLNLMSANWDGEDAVKPNLSAIKDAVSFARNLDDKFYMPEPMLHETGNVSLYWNTKDSYADIEFLGEKRFAYFIKHEEDKHKGVCKINDEKMPAVLKVLLTA